MRQPVQILIVTAVVAAALAFCTTIGYELGKATPCTDEESFEIHPLE